MITLNNFRAEHPNFIVWIGEWGAFKPDYDQKMLYYASITGYAKEYEIPWAIWDYASGWGPYNSSSGWKTDFLNAMGMGEFIN